MLQLLTNYFKIKNNPVTPNGSKYTKRKNIFGKDYYTVDRGDGFMNNLRELGERLAGYAGLTSNVYTTNLPFLGELPLGLTAGGVSKDTVLDELRGVATTDESLNEYLTSLSDEQLLNLLDEYGGNVDSFKKDILELKGLDNIPELPTFESVTEDMGEMPDMPDYNAILEDIYSGGDEAVNKYLAELQADEDRQTSLLRNQLTENNRAFDDYRSQVLSNQYQQNAQLMGTVGSEMSRARRNAIEAGASAGMRIAENVNTVLSMQNKQSQLSLETSNQLAQQLLNQRQAAMGITGSYNEMLSKNSSERRAYKDQAADTRFNRGVSNYNAWNQQANDRYNNAMTDYNTNLDKWNSQFDPSSNSLASGYQAHLQKKQSQYK